MQHGVPQASDMQLGELAGGGVVELELLFEIGAHGKGYLKANGVSFCEAKARACAEQKDGRIVLEQMFFR